MNDIIRGQRNETFCVSRSPEPNNYNVKYIIHIIRNTIYPDNHPSTVQGLSHLKNLLIALPTVILVIFPKPK